MLADGRVIPADYRTFTHGYAVTSHAAQGKTVEQVLLVASSRSLPAINQEQFYVSISRGRERCQVFTDDSDLLRSHVTRSSARLAHDELEARAMNDHCRFTSPARAATSRPLQNCKTARNNCLLKPCLIRARAENVPGGFLGPRFM